MEERMREKGGKSLVGKIWIDRQIGREFVESTMGKIWRVSKPARFQEIGTNTFIITFSTYADKDKVLDDRPWLFDNYLFELKLFDGLAQVQSIVFDAEVFWIRMLNLPLGSMNEECGRMIGSTMGRVLEVDVPEDGIGWGSSLRVRIEIPIQQAITRGRMIAMEGKKVWVSFKYEKLSRLCFECGLMVHVESGCCKLGGGRGKGPQYGTWLQAEKTTKGAFWRSDSFRRNRGGFHPGSNENVGGRDRWGKEVREKEGENREEVMVGEAMSEERGVKGGGEKGEESFNEKRREEEVVREVVKVKMGIENSRNEEVVEGEIMGPEASNKGVGIGELMLLQKGGGEEGVVEEMQSRSKGEVKEVEGEKNSKNSDRENVEENVYGGRWKRRAREKGCNLVTEALKSSKRKLLGEEGSEKNQS